MAYNQDCEVCGAEYCRRHSEEEQDKARFKRRKQKLGAQTVVLPEGSAECRCYSDYPLYYAVIGLDAEGDPGIVCKKCSPKCTGCAKYFDHTYAKTCANCTPKYVEENERCATCGKVYEVTLYDFDEVCSACRHIEYHRVRSVPTKDDD